MMRKLMPFLGLLLVFGFAKAQRCGTASPDPNSAFQQSFNSRVRLNSQHKVNVLRIVPVAVHVIYRRENADHNISDAQIQSQITILNQDFRGQGGGIDSEIEFCLAGIRRIENKDHYQVQKGVNDVQAKALSQAPPQNFLNIWVVDELKGNGGNTIAGFAQLPDKLTSDPQTDGVMIADQHFGNVGTATSGSPLDLGRTATHEVGHWLNLLHTHEIPGCDGPQNCFVTGDCCCDTPPQAGSNIGCPTGLNSCQTDQPDLPDPIHNYMSYSFDACMNMFTTCQISRMNLCLDSVRQSTWSFAGGDCPVFRLANTAPTIVELEVKVYPNPITSNSVIEVQLPRTEVVSMELFDVQGRMVERVFGPEVVEGGVLRRAFPATLAKGRYFLRVRVGGDIMVKVVMVD
jgi:hypothetical protein